MWAHQLSGPLRFEKTEVATPRAEDLETGQVLLATRAGGICGSDLPNFKGAPFPLLKSRGGWATRWPGFPMHEVAGEVVASRHPDHQAGDHVVGWASGFDGIAEFVVSKGDGLAGYDPGLSPQHAVMLQPLACVLFAAEKIGAVAGKHVAVVGQGPIGLLFSHVLKQFGAQRVTGIDRVDRSEAAGVFGIDETVTASAASWASSLRPDDRPEVVVEAVGHQVTTLKNCLDAAAFGGQVFYFGIPDDQVYPVDMMTLLRKNLTLRSGDTHERRRMLRDADTYLAAHPDLRDRYVSDVFHVGDVQTAFTAAINPKEGQYKIALDMS